MKKVSPIIQCSMDKHKPTQNYPFRMKVWAYKQLFTLASWTVKSGFQALSIGTKQDATFDLMSSRIRKASFGLKWTASIGWFLNFKYEIFQHTGLFLSEQKCGCFSTSLLHSKLLRNVNGIADLEVFQDSFLSCHLKAFYEKYQKLLHHCSDIHLKCFR